VKGVKKLPLNMLDALRLTDKSKVLRERLGTASSTAISSSRTTNGRPSTVI
jgi:hypothetical protein